MNVSHIKDDIIYLLNVKERTAAIIGCFPGIVEVFIPCSIIYNSIEYVVTTILKNSFNKSKIKSIKFANDSKVKVIEEKSI